MKVADRNCRLGSHVRVAGQRTLVKNSFQRLGQVCSLATVGLRSGKSFSQNRKSATVGQRSGLRADQNQETKIKGKIRDQR